MAKGGVKEVIYGKHAKYEVRESSGLTFNRTYVIYKDGKYWKGSYDSLARAVEVARDAG